MKVRLLNYWEEIRSSYWFLPTVMAIAAILLSFFTIAIDDTLQDDWYRQFGFIWGGGADGARELLSTVAGSMITVAGVIFSITMVVLSQAASQYGPYVLRNFMRNTPNQIVLGTFTSTFIYALLILRTIRSNDDFTFVPNISITVTIFFALASLGVLIFYIHHIGLSIQASYIIAQIAKDLFKTIEQVFPENLGSKPPEGEDNKAGNATQRLADLESSPVTADHSGYLQAIDNEGILAVARDDDLILELTHRPGHFIIQGDLIAKVYPAERLNAEIEGKIQKAFIIGNQRNSTQDMEFAVDQMVEVAVRALSPSVNDPHTTIICIDWLGALLTRLTEKEFPSPYRYDEAGILRVFARHPETFKGITDEAFDQIRQNIGHHVAVRVRMLEVIAVIADHARTDEQREALLRQANMIRSRTRAEHPEREDRKDVSDRFQEIRRQIANPFED